MSVLLEFSMFPIDGEESKSEYVGRIIDMVDKSGLKYQLTPMGTIIESDDIGEALKIVQRAYGVLEQDCNRVYSSIKLDIRKGKTNALRSKIKSVEKLVGRKVKV
ncbi:MAG: hypothetical protein CR967_01655 [Proteobacteria bacterium]|nr:MAG: hypothetical protein CR967_01655 [Pseudomonadota bacterium]